MVSGSIDLLCGATGGATGQLEVRGDDRVRPCLSAWDPAAERDESKLLNFGRESAQADPCFRVGSDRLVRQQHPVDTGPLHNE